MFYKSSETILGLDHYWFFLFLGVVVTVIFSFLRRKKYGLSIPLSIIYTVFFFVQALLGAKLLFGLERVFATGSFSDFNMSGQSLYGGIFMSALYAPAFALLSRKKCFMMYDYTAPYGMILLAFCRMGCFADGCCGARLMYIDGKPLYLPVQLFEMTTDLIILALLFYWEEKKLNWHKITDENQKKPSPYNGVLFFVMLMAYGTCRFFFEFIRVNSKVFLGMSFGQIYSILFVLLGAAVLYYQYKKRVQSDTKHKKQPKKKQIQA